MSGMQFKREMPDTVDSAIERANAASGPRSETGAIK